MDESEWEGDFTDNESERTSKEENKSENISPTLN